MVDKGKSISEILLSFIKTFKPQLAWESDKVKNWLYDPTQIDEKEIKKFVLDELTIFYDKRAGDLIMNHPLAIQVNLATGVANGVLVVREIEDCAKLIYNIVRKTLEFDIDSTTKKGYIYLKEIISNCILRVQTADKMLTNTFWNFYLKDLEE